MNVVMINQNHLAIIKPKIFIKFFQNITTTS